MQHDDIDFDFDMNDKQVDFHFNTISMRPHAHAGEKRSKTVLKN